MVSLNTPVSTRTFVLVCVFAGMVSFGIIYTMSVGYSTDIAVANMQPQIALSRPKVNAKWVCGDGSVDPGEQCDDGVKNGRVGDICDVSCKLAKTKASALCGNGKIDLGEQCDPTPCPKGKTCVRRPECLKGYVCNKECKCITKG